MCPFRTLIPSYSDHRHHHQYDNCRWHQVHSRRQCDDDDDDIAIILTDRYQCINVCFYDEALWCDELSKRTAGHGSGPVDRWGWVLGPLAPRFAEPSTPYPRAGAEKRFSPHTIKPRSWTVLYSLYWVGNSVYVHFLRTAIIPSGPHATLKGR